ncbi:MAG: hypothetical protein V3U03_17040, partial [Myxococcota bacterium]
MPLAPRWRRLPLILLALAGLALAGPRGAAAQAPVRGDAPVTRSIPAGSLAAPPISRGFVTLARVSGGKSAIAVCGLALLVWGAALRRVGRPDALQRLRDGLLLALGAVGGLAWWNFLAFHYPGFQHPADTYHYYIGAKYFPELGYTRLYECTALADARAGLSEQVAARRIRDLETNRLGSTAAVLGDPARCTGHFSPPRWQAFQRDIAWFRGRVPARRWRLAQVDHGYNATPAWGMAGSLLARTGPASDRQLLALALLDPLLLLAMWGSWLWAFGWRATCIALLFWGTNHFAPFGWTGGGYLRQDWLVAAIVAICLLRRGHPAAGGFLLTYAGFLRVFPGLIVVAIGLGAGLHAWRRRQLALPEPLRRFALGCALAVALVLPLSVLSAGGLGAWADFVENSRIHLSTPLRNHVGLRTVLSYDPAGRSSLTRDASLEDPYAPWKEQRRAVFAGRRVLFWGLVLGFVVLLARAAEGRELWVAAALGIGLIPIATELTSYYYGVLFGCAALWLRRESVGIALCALSALTWLIADRWHWYDEIFTWSSLAAVAFAVFAAAVFA